MVYEVGSKGLQEVNLNIPQHSSLSFAIVHVDDSTGNVIDHSNDTANMAFESKDDEPHEIFVDLDDCVDCGAESILVSIPPSVSESLPVGQLNWDLFIDMGEERLRLCYGKVRIYDSYALDR